MVLSKTFSTQVFTVVLLTGVITLLTLLVLHKLGKQNTHILDNEKMLMESFSATKTIKLQNERITDIGHEKHIIEEKYSLLLEEKVRLEHELNEVKLEIEKLREEKQSKINKVDDLKKVK